MVPPDDLILTRYTQNRAQFRIAGHRVGGGLIEVLQWQLSFQRAKWPREIANGKYPPLPQRVYGNNLKATWIGHSTVLLQTQGLNILTDPFLSMRASPTRHVGPRRVRKAALQAPELPPVDIVLISHNHYDHLDLPGLRGLLKHHDPVFVVPLRNKKHLRSLAVTKPVIELDWRETHREGDIAITAMPALHWSKRSLNDSFRSLWAAFVIETPGGVIYFAGDTGYGDGATFHEVRHRFGSPRLSLLPIGAYEPRWFMKSVHMNPQDAVLAHHALASRTSIAIHHATIQLTDEPIDQPVLDLALALAKIDIGETQFLAPHVGESLDIG